MASYADGNLHHRLPEDLVIEILIRLPVKSLLQFKSVCKYWYSLIKSPSFVSKHHHHQKRKNNGRLLLQHFNEDTQQFGFALFHDETLYMSTYHDLDLDHHHHHLQLSNYDEHVERPIDGLFCLFNLRDRIMMWNPAMREFRILPFPHHPDPPNGLLGHAIGFGLDPLSDDYKVVFIWQFSYLMRGQSRQEAYVMVYTFRTNTWRYLGCLASFLPRNFVLFNSRSSTYLNGLYHWWVDHPKRVILAFDMGKDVFREISGPSNIPSYEMESNCIGTLALYKADHIALFLERDLTGSDIDKRIDIWVMEEEGYWIKQFTVGPLPGVSWQLGFWKNGEPLLVVDPSLLVVELIDHNNCSQTVLYNPSTQEIRDIGPK